MRTLLPLILAALSSSSGAAAPRALVSRPIEHVTSWLGNTYPGAKQWVQQDIRAMAVTEDGTVFTNVEWEEGGGNVGEIGLQDIRECLVAHRRADGEFIVFLEDDFKSKVVKWPVIAPLDSPARLQVEDWTLAVRRLDATNETLLGFTLVGSKTGQDGEGRSDARFVSTSSRVVIETNDWNVTYALSLGGIKPVPDQFEVSWKVEPRWVDEFISPGVTNTATETVMVLASGLANAKHTLEISGSDTTPIAALRVYRPPLNGGTPP